MISEHQRSYDKGQQIEDNAHIQALVDSKKQARHHRAQISLQKRREQHHQHPPINLDLPDDKRIRDQVVHVHKLNDYDQLQSTTTE